MVIVNFRIAMNAEIGNLLLVDFAELLKIEFRPTFVILAAVGASLLITVPWSGSGSWLQGGVLFSRKRGFRTLGG